MSHNYLDDIPLSLARAAHVGTSFDPRKRADQEIASYCNMIAEAKEKGVEDIERYRNGLKKRYIALLSAKSRCLSPMIAGPARFPTRRNEKANNSADNRTRELLDYHKKAIAYANKGPRPIMSGDDDALDRLRAELAELESRDVKPALPKQLNRPGKHPMTNAEYMAMYPYYRQKQLITIDGTPYRIRRAMIKDPVQGGSVSVEVTLSDKPIHDAQGVEDYDPIIRIGGLGANGKANIRRIKARIVEIEKLRTMEAVNFDLPDGVKFEDCPADARFRLFFPGKPNEATRSSLKSSGFRWAPSLGCWQSYRNTKARDFIESMKGATV